MSKKIEFQSKRGIKLVGILENEKAKKCVILVHGFCDNKDGMGRWIKLSFALQKENYAVFRFDFGECGESESTEISLTGQLADLEAAIDLMKEKYKEIGMVGHSLGGLCVLKLANQANTVVSWAGTTEGNHPSVFDDFEKTKTGYKVTFEKTFHISKKYKEERTSLNTKEIISLIKIPALLIHGSTDKDVPVSQTINAEKYLKNGKIKIVEGEGHGFNHKTAEVIALTVDWLKHYL